MKQETIVTIMWYGSPCIARGGDVIGAAYVVGAIIGCAIGAEIVGAAIVRGAAYVVGAAIGAANVVCAA